jgi:Heterokaryon incompatibility protein (HET)
MSLKALPAQPSRLVDKFTHEPLNLATRNIRAIKVLSDPKASTIRCTVEHTSLFDSHTCLSYTWGEPHNKKIILLNGKQYEIQSNLWDFLWTARANGISDPLWIDALCIDQRNTAERNHQVQQMADIFQHAKQVLVWLGSGNHQIENLLGVISIFGHQYRNARESDWCLPRQILQTAGSRFWNSYYALDKLQYWGRLWIVQEIHHAKNALLLYGNSLCKWDHYRWLALLVRRCRAKLKQRHPHIPRLKLVSGLSGLAFSEKSDFAELLRSFGRFHCADIRDRVFALLSLAKQRPDAREFSVDYHLDTLHLFFEVNRYWAPWADESFTHDLFKALEMVPEDFDPPQLARRYPSVLSQTIEPKYCLTLNFSHNMLFDILAVDPLASGLLASQTEGSDDSQRRKCCTDCAQRIEPLHLNSPYGNPLDYASLNLCVDKNPRIYIQRSRGDPWTRTQLERFHIIRCTDPGRMKPFTMQILLSPGPDIIARRRLRRLTKTWILRVWERDTTGRRYTMRIGLLTCCTVEECCFRDPDASSLTVDPSLKELDVVFPTWPSLQLGILGGMQVLSPSPGRPSK